ncbi:ZNF384 family protein [Megaselia abdita]
MDFVSVSIISVADFAQPDRFPTYKIPLDQIRTKYVKLKRVLVQQEEGWVYGEVDNDDEEANEHIHPKVLEVALPTPEMPGEIITPDNDHLNNDNANAQDVQKSPEQMQADKNIVTFFPSDYPLSKQIPEYDSDDHEECPSFEIFEDSISEDGFFSSLLSVSACVKQENNSEKLETNGDQKEGVENGSQPIPKEKPDDNLHKIYLPPKPSMLSEVNSEVPVLNGQKEEESQNNKTSNNDTSQEEGVETPEEKSTVKGGMDIDEEDSNQNGGEGYEIMDFNSDSENEGSNDEKYSSDEDDDGNSNNDTGNGVGVVTSTGLDSRKADEDSEEEEGSNLGKEEPIKDTQENIVEDANIKSNDLEKVDEKNDKVDSPKVETPLDPIKETVDPIDDMIIEDEGSEENGSGESGENLFVEVDDRPKDPEEEVDDFIQNVFEELEKSKAVENPKDNQLLADLMGIPSNDMDSNEYKQNDNDLKIIEINVNNQEDDNSFDDLIEEQSEGKDEGALNYQDLIEEIEEDYDDDAFQDSTVEESIEESFENMDEDDEATPEEIAVVNEPLVRGDCPAPFTCHICNAESHDRRGFVDHMRANHPEAPIVFKNMDIKEIKCLEPGASDMIRKKHCLVCNKTMFRGIVDYNDHVNGHKKEKPYICGCGAKFSYRYNFGAHRKSCKTPFKDSQVPKYAEASFSKVETSKSDEHLPLNQRVCKICNRTGFNSIIAFHDHKNLHSQEKPYKCKCGFVSNLFSNLILHLKKEGCSLDDTTWPAYAQSYKESREQKLRAYGGKKNVKKRVRFAKDLPVPKRILKNSDKMYCCWECNFCSPTTSSVYAHYETQHMEKKVKCSECDKFFSTDVKMCLHRKKMHEDLEKCKFCPMMIQKNRLKKHVEVYHKKPYQCDECGTFFAYERTMKAHVDRMHNRIELEPLFVTCPLCENPVDINNESIECHLSSRFHWVYEASWREYNDIDSIPCYDCEDWETTEFEDALKHFMFEHKKGTRNSIDFLSILGKQDPDLIKAVKEKTDKCAGLPQIKERKQVEEMKVLLQESKYANFTTCFICNSHIKYNDQPLGLDRSLKAHLAKRSHLSQVEDWENTFLLNTYPCQDCNIENLNTLSSAMQHSKRAHEYSYFEYFEFLRSYVAPAPDSTKKARCFICSEKVLNMKSHLANSSPHKLAEIKWLKSINLKAFPCAFCPTKSENLIDAHQHAFKEHKQPCVEYMQYLQLQTNDEGSGNHSNSSSATTSQKSEFEIKIV